jgi:two-component system cell cycle response regulator
MTTILIAEDYPALRQLFERLLLSEGFVVETVSNGLALVQRALVLAPDVILTDVWMPALSGIEAITYLRADARTAHIPIIALSAEPTTECPALAAGAQAFFVKPPPLDALLATIRMLLTERSLP